MEIQGFENYLIYSDGRVFSKKRNKFLKPRMNSWGYNFVTLCKDGKTKHMLIHRLVGIHYIPNHENKRCIDHINRDRSDNRLENLRWATHSENNQNKGVGKNNKCGHKNISYHVGNKLYRYEKMIDGKRIIKYFV